MRALVRILARCAQAAAVAAPLWLAAASPAVDGTWSGFGSGPGQPILECLHPVDGGANGHVFVVTAAAGSGGAVMMWNGSQWRTITDLGSSANGPLIQGVAASPTSADAVVYGLAAFPVVGGASNAIARFDGIQLQGMEGGIATLDNYSGINSASYSPDGTLYVGGDFAQIGGVAANGIAAWNGTAWSTVGGSDLGAVLLVASGKDGWVDAYGAAGYQQWDGTAWSNMLGNQDNGIDAMAMDAEGDLFIAHGVGDPASDVYEWNTTAYAHLGQGITQPGVNGFGILGAAVAPDGTLYVTGDFAGTAQGGSTIALSNLARWNGSAWEEVGGGVSGGIGYGVAFIPDAGSSTGYDVVVSGSFTRAGSGASAVAVSGVARFRPAAASAGSGSGTGNGAVTSGVGAQSPGTGGCGLGGGGAAALLALACALVGRRRRR